MLKLLTAELSMSSREFMPRARAPLSSLNPRRTRVAGEPGPSRTQTPGPWRKFGDVSVSPGCAP